MPLTLPTPPDVRSYASRPDSPVEYTLLGTSGQFQISLHIFGQQEPVLLRQRLFRQAPQGFCLQPSPPVWKDIHQRRQRQPQYIIRRACCFAPTMAKKL